MATISISTPSDGQTIDASDVNTPLNTIVAAINGNLDNDNIATAAAISGSKLGAATLPGSKFDTTLQGGWIASVLPAVSSVTANGNHSYDVTFASTVASTLTPGARLRLSRTVTAPTQCTDLESSSSQYYSKSSPAGMTFTDDFVVSAWVKLESYVSGTVVARFNGTSGWRLNIVADGRVNLQCYNAGVGNYSQVVTYQSIPLGKWVHIAAQIDMSAFTATTTTSYVMIDGLDVPAQVLRAGTNPTALVQAGDLQVGAYNGATEPFDGKIAQVAIYSAKVTQATIKASMNQTLTGAETSLVSAYSFNNSINDLSANANNLTANGSAVATNADSPFALDANGTPGGTYEWGIVTKVATTVATVQTPEGSAIPTSGGVSTVDMSVHKAPFGFTVDRGRWTLEVFNRNIVAQTTPVQSTWYNIALQQLTVPIGAWNLGHTTTAYSDRAVAGDATLAVTLSTANNTESERKYTFYGQGANSIAFSYTSTVSNFENVATSTIYYLNIKTSAASIQTIYNAADRGLCVIRAELALL